MASSYEPDHVIRDLELQVTANKNGIEEIKRALYGSPEYGLKGFREEMEHRVNTLEKSVESTKNLCEDLRQQRRDEENQRQGTRRVLGYIGVTNVITLVTLIGALVAIWQGAFGGS